MSKRNLLIVHGSGIIRHRLKSFVLSELDDVEVFEAPSAQEAVLQCQRQKIEVIVCGKELPDVSGLELFKKAQALPADKAIAFILITSTSAAENIQELVMQGVSHYLVFPFTSKDLRDKINLACDPRKWRTSERIHIPDVKAIIHSNYEEIEADVINLSINGVACDFLYTSEYYNILGGTSITLKFPAEYNNAKAENLPCKFLRLNVLSWKPDGAPEHIRAAWAITAHSAGSRKIIEQVFEEAKKGLE